MAAMLRNVLNVKKGDHVVIYMPQILETTVALLACARIGAVTSSVFCFYGSELLTSSIEKV
jgi:acyl-coenzyme A synthetase/AMP-(fatty) acid ligase